ncbi:uncharacterized protein LOC131068761 [Cryptomeria japonica]|uniref:uncharacterized protein LOC131068761 n=1 Tax=Cryptomeria japonica TaxID=3369 RepID=UPI0027DA849D|nr:uncharacterized protein LOC131068761 [Cryptomeria japonica]
MDEEDPELHHSSCSGELIPGILNDITLGPIIGRMAIHTKFRLAKLNRDWEKALMNPDPALAKFYADYSRRLNPRPLPNPNSILVHTYTLSHFPYDACPVGQSLSIYQGGVLTNLPLLEQMEIDFRKSLRFVIADNRIYSLVPIFDPPLDDPAFDDPAFDDRHEVSVLDLCRGSLCFHWESVATVQIPEECSVCSSTLTSQDGSSSVTSIWAYQSGSHDPRNLSHWRHRFVSNEEGEWEKISPPSPPPPPLPNGELPPKYVEIYEKETKDRYLYKRDTCTQLILRSGTIPPMRLRQSRWPERMLVVFKDDYNANTGELNAMHRVIKTYARNCNDCDCDFNLQRLYLKDQNAELIVDNEELTTFQKDWPSFISQSEIDLHRFMKMKISVGCKEWEGQFSMAVRDLWKQRMLNYISLTQDESIIIYRCIAKKPKLERTFFSQMLSRAWKVIIKIGLPWWEP